MTTRLGPAATKTQTKEAAQTVGIELLSLPIKTANEISPALAFADDQHASAIIVAADPLTGANNRGTSPIAGQDFGAAPGVRSRDQAHTWDSLGSQVLNYFLNRSKR